jgi:spore coat protein A
MPSAKTTSLAMLCALAAWATAPAARAAGLLNPTMLTKYLDPLPIPSVIAPTGTLGGAPLYEVSVTQFQQQLHSQLPSTTLWGYNGTYPGPTFDVNRGDLIKVRWTNNLKDSSGQPLQQHLLPYDGTLHGTVPGEAGGHAGHSEGDPYPQVRMVTHLHGGVVDEKSDGYPEHWFSNDPNAAANGLGGPAGNSFVTTYPNNQRAATMWYHDHAMGVTRLNVYAGMAGFYLNRDPQELALNLPSGKYEVPLVIQDRQFYDDGQLYYPDPVAPASPATSFYGDVNLVNGKVWPFMEVEPRKYRLRMLNGANSRNYTLSLVPDTGPSAGTPVTIHQIGTDGGLFSQTIDRTSVGLAAADRADVIVDFAQFSPGDMLRLLNVGPNQSSETDEVMQFRVVAPTGPDTSSLPTSLVPVPRYNPADAVRTRRLRLTRTIDAQGREQMLLDGKLWSEMITEVLKLHEPEIWEIRNLTNIDHPIHLHMEAFQLVGRMTATNQNIPLADWELGWEDTVNIPAGQVARFMVRYDAYAGTFVWHCHLLEHEDHEMMRPFMITPEPASGALVAFAGLALVLCRRRAGRASLGG